MKLRDLDGGAGGPAVWTLRWLESPPPGVSGGEAVDGVLEGVTRLGNRLLLRVNVSGRRRTATLEWQPPPRVSEIEALLVDRIGIGIRDLGELELPTRAVGSAPPPSRGRDGR